MDELFASSAEPPSNTCLVLPPLNGGESHGMMQHRARGEHTRDLVVLRPEVRDSSERIQGACNILVL